MIRLTRINETPFYVNADLIEFVDQTPDTVLTLTNGEKVRVRERAEEVVERVIVYKRRVTGGGPGMADAAEPEG
ncbi:MAG: flagellar FlbD family protein [Bryobacteraceae bacterium]|nr:MAG: flagellar FlbD family protein [Bryobacteraceae bacterium]